ncbi:MAG: META domain-containing protein [Anaerolineales bacterium]
MRLTNRTIALGVLILLLAACAPAPAGQNLVGTSWSLVSLDGSIQLGEAIGGQAVTLSFDASTQAGGSGGCNRFGAEYSAKAQTGAIAFSNIISTLMACIGEGIGEVEASYFEALSLADTYRVDGSRLTIAGGGHTLVFERTSEST